MHDDHPSNHYDHAGDHPGHLGGQFPKDLAIVDEPTDPRGSWRRRVPGEFRSEEEIYLNFVVERSFG